MKCLFLFKCVLNKYFTYNKAFTWNKSKKDDYLFFSVRLFTYWASQWHSINESIKSILKSTSFPGPLCAFWWQIDWFIHSAAVNYSLSCFKVPHCQDIKWAFFPEIICNPQLRNVNGKFPGVKVKVVWIPGGIPNIEEKTGISRGVNWKKKSISSTWGLGVKIFFSLKAKKDLLICG